MAKIIHTVVNGKNVYEAYPETTEEKSALKQFGTWISTDLQSLKDTIAYDISKLKI